MKHALKLALTHTLKPVLSVPLSRLLIALSLLLLTVGGAFAKPPMLEPLPTQDLPSEVRPGQALSFSMNYKGDPPTALTMVVQTPGGDTVRVPSKLSGTAGTNGAPVTWPFTPGESGSYKYHFEASAGDFGSTRYPASPNDDPQFVAVNLFSKYIILATGLLIALFFLPFVVYMAARSANKRGDPSAAARIALLIGVVASYALFLYLFYAVYSVLLLALAGVVMLGLLIVLLTRRRTA